MRAPLEPLAATVLAIAGIGIYLAWLTTLGKNHHSPTLVERWDMFWLRHAQWTNGWRSYVVTLAIVAATLVAAFVLPIWFALDVMGARELGAGLLIMFGAFCIVCVGASILLLLLAKRGASAEASGVGLLLLILTLISLLGLNGWNFYR